MTRLAWVKRPMLAPDMPKHVAIASSYAALNPKDELWRRYIDEIERRRTAGTITDEEYHVLRSSREAREVLMDRTFGREDAFTAGTVDEVLAHATAVIQGEVRAEVEQAQYSARVAEAGAQEERGRRQRLEVAHLTRAERRADRTATALSWLAVSPVATAVVIGVLATIPGVPVISVNDFSARLAIWIVALTTLFLVIVRHISILEIRRVLAQSTRNRLIARSKRQLDSLVTSEDEDRER